MTKILLIEDDRWLAELESDLLTDAGYEVRVVYSAVAAIDAVDDFTPDAIVADVLLDGSTIFGLLHELQSYTDTQTVPVVLCTSIAEQFSSSQLDAYGVKRVIDKTTMESDAIVTALRGIKLL